MLVKFIGAIERVTGSCSWLKHNETQFLVDCGMIQGESHDHFENEKPFPFKPRELKFIFLTHSHLDHCGLIPRLYREGFIGRVYCTRATAKLATEIMLDAEKLDAPYDKYDVAKVKFSHIDERKDFKWGKFSLIDNGLSFAVYRSAHILGSVSIGVSWDKERGKSILFTGDIGNNTRSNSYQPLLKCRQSPHKDFGYIVCESTYGARERDLSECDFHSRIDKLESEIIKTIHEKQGNLLIPTFSMHRTQEILFDLYYILNSKWNGKLKEGKQRLSIKNYLNKYGIMSLDRSIKNDVFQSFLNDDKIPKNIRGKIKSCCFKCFVFSENKFQDLLINISVNIDLNDYKTTSHNSIYLSSYKINDDAVSSKIEAYLLKSNSESNIKIKFEAPEDVKELYADLEELIEIDEIPINVIYDSPLGKRISNIYGEELTSSYYNGNESKKLYLNNTMSKWLNVGDDELDTTLSDLYTKNTINIGVHSINNKTKKSLKNKGSSLQNTPTVILSSSGMCDAGPVLSHLNRDLENEKNTILLTGYQSGGTNGNTLSRLNEFSTEEKEEKSIKLKNRDLSCIDIKASISSMTGYSGHADQKSLLNYLFTENEGAGYTIPNIIINHGDNYTRDTFKAIILQRSKEFSEKYKNSESFKTNVIIPTKENDWYDLDKNEWVKEQEQSSVITPDQGLIYNALLGLTKAIEDLTKEVSKINSK